MSLRSRGRKIALQTLYLMEWNGWECDVETALDRLLETTDVGAKNLSPKEEDLSAEHPSVSFARGLLAGIVERREEVDGIIARCARNWRLDRMAMVDRNILRIGVYELMFSNDVPPKVAINEAVELAKRFGAEDSAPFVNGILDAVHKGKRVR